MVATNKTYIRGLTIVLYRKKPEIVTYTEMVATNKTYIRGLTIVSEDWLSEHQADYFRYY